MNKITYVKAEMKNLNEIMEVYKKGILVMEAQGIHQWDELYPCLDVLKEDVEKNQLTVGIINGRVAAVFVLNQDMDEQYQNGSWRDDTGDYLVIHRICVNPDYQKQGIGTETIRYIERISKESGKNSIRLDAFSQNPFSLRMYAKLGYEITGEANWRKGMFYLMEKLI